MNLNRMLLVCGMLFTLVGLSSMAAEFSPTLDSQLEKLERTDFVSAIVILESPIDIRALDMRLHDTGATLAKRHSEVINALKYNAESTQPAIRGELEEALKSGTVKGYTAHWIENLFVISATKEFVESLRERGDIKYATENFEPVLFEPLRDSGGSSKSIRRSDNTLDSETTTPGQDAIRATEVNQVLGITGQGVLVANIDTGVDGTHGALADRWRGNFAPHSECWLDLLDNGSTTPVDYGGHGTHVMGTITGREIIGSDTNTVGSAPNALWIATNPIDQGVSSGFDNDIIDAFEWLTDPDDDPLTLDDVPDVIQNSWGVNGNFTGYVDCFDYWNTVILNCEAAGPVITWSAGNEGPTASSLRAPAIYSFNEYQIFSVGAVDATNYSAPYPIASFSSRGPTQCTPYSPDNIKPEISAPGVDVYSSVPGGGYDGTYSGTSMAGPHVAGVVALMREACPDCDYITIKDAIITTAIDYGDAGNDNTYGFGFIDAYEAVLAVSNLGRIGGVVDDGSNPLEGVKAEIVGEGKSALSDADGEYYLPLQPGTYDVEFSKFGYISQTVYGLTVTEGDTTFQNITLSLAPQGTLSGTVTSCYGGPAVGATVEIVGAPVTPATTDGTGYYSFTIPQGTYDVSAYGAGCGEQTANDVVVTASTTQDFTLPTDPRFECSAPDAGGYIACENGDGGGPVYSWYEISPNAGGSGTHTGITGDDAGVSVSIPFNFRFYGTDYTNVWICSNGFISFSGTPTAYENESLPGTALGSGIAVNWDDMNPLSAEHISYYYYAAENAFIIEWYDIAYWRDNASTATFQIWLYDVATNPGPNGDSQIRIQYQNLDLSGSETVGLTNGSTASQYTANGSDDVSSQGLENSRVISYGGEAAEYGTLQGVVTDASTLLPLENVLVTRVGSAQTATSNSSGAFAMNIAPGTYDFEFTLDEYFPVTLEGILIEDGVTVIENISMTAVPIVTSFAEDFESGAPGWTHTANIGWTDNWHLSTEDANSGTTSYKCGDTGTGDYDNSCDALLTSPVITNLPDSSWLSFVSSMTAEASSLNPDSAYDGGFLEISVNAGGFVPLVLDAGYTHTFRYCGNSTCSALYNGPTPGVSCLSGTDSDWLAYTVDLSSYTGDDVQFRFRFGSDGGVTDEGWYVDDVYVKSYGSALSAPNDLTIFVDFASGNLVFHWTDTGASNYQLYSSTNSDGPFDTFVGSSATNSLTIPYPADAMLYYVVVASN